MARHRMGNIPTSGRNILWRLGQQIFGITRDFRAYYWHIILLNYGIPFRPSSEQLKNPIRTKAPAQLGYRVRFQIRLSKFRRASIDANAQHHYATQKDTWPVVIRKTVRRLWDFLDKLCPGRLQEQPTVLSDARCFGVPT